MSRKIIGNSHWNAYREKAWGPIYSHVQQQQNNICSSEKLSKGIDKQVHKKKKELQINYETKPWHFHPLSTMFDREFSMSPLTDDVFLFL